MKMKIGVLALQGSIAEHVAILKKCNVEAVKVKKVSDLDDVSGLIIPGGESTAISKLMKLYNLDKAIKQRFRQGMPIYGTCAGAILLAKEIIGNDVPALNLMDISIKRNDYGRQIDSFEADLTISGLKKPFRGIFIRAPVINSFTNGVKILSEFQNKPVMAQQGNLLVSTFHPELTDDTRVHGCFFGIVEKNG